MSDLRSSGLSLRPAGRFCSVLRDSRDSSEGGGAKLVSSSLSDSPKECFLSERGWVCELPGCIRVHCSSIGAFWWL